MIKWLWVSIYLIWMAPAAWGAGQLESVDFAFGLSLPVAPGASVMALHLPARIYQQVVRADLGDMRVFNSADEPVPHLLRMARSQANDPPWEAMRFFPLPSLPTNAPKDYRIYVRTHADGAVVSVDSGDLSVAKREFLIDPPARQQPLAALKLQWTAGAHGGLTSWAVDGSDDLTHWNRLVDRAVIADLRHNAHQLRNQIIDLPQPATWRYIRLRQTGNHPPLAITDILGRQQAQADTAQRLFLNLSGQPDANHPGVFIYDTRGVFPIDRVNLVFSQPNSLAQARLASRSHAKQTWQPQYSGLFYRLHLDGADLTCRPAPIAVTTNRYWQLTTIAAESTLGQAIPTLAAGYRPHTLYFLARGQGPFILAFGSAQAMPLPVDISGLVDDMTRQGMVQWITPGNPVTLGGPDRLTPAAPPAPWRRIVLWLALVCGVAVLAAMAWRLYRGMNAA